MLLLAKLQGFKIVSIKYCNFNQKNIVLITLFKLTINCPVFNPKIQNFNTSFLILKSPFLHVKIILKSQFSRVKIILRSEFLQVKINRLRKSLKSRFLQVKIKKLRKKCINSFQYISFRVKIILK